MAKPDLGERTSAALLGVVFGGIIGLALAWLLGVYSNTLGSGAVRVSFQAFALAGAAIFGAVGAVLGSHLGTVLGRAISLIFAFEGAGDAGLPRWALVALVVGAIVLAAWLVVVWR